MLELGHVQLEHGFENVCSRELQGSEKRMEKGADSIHKPTTLVLFIPEHDIFSRKPPELPYVVAFGDMDWGIFSTDPKGCTTAHDVRQSQREFLERNFAAGLWKSRAFDCKVHASGPCEQN